MARDGFSKDANALRISRKASLWTILGLAFFTLARVAGGTLTWLLFAVGCVFWVLVIAAFIEMLRYRRVYRAGRAHGNEVTRT